VRPDQELEGRYIITEVAPDGEPIPPEAATQKYVRQCGCLVRDHIPISFRLWKPHNPNEQRDAMTETEKEWLWRELKKNFTVWAESEESTKGWTLSKMPEQLQTFQKNLTKNYIKKRKTPEFTGDLAKQKDHWNAFVEYKSLELGIRNVEKSKEMPQKKYIITL